MDAEEVQPFDDSYMSAVFTQGLLSSGSKYVDQIARVIRSEYTLDNAENRELDSIMYRMKQTIARYPDKLHLIKLQDFFDDNISPYLYGYYCGAVECIGVISPRAESVCEEEETFKATGDMKSQSDDYEDDTFEDEDDQESVPSECEDFESSEDKYFENSLHSVSSEYNSRKAIDTGSSTPPSAVQRPHSTPANIRLSSDAKPVTDSRPTTSLDRKGISTSSRYDSKEIAPTYVESEPKISSRENSQENWRQHNGAHTVDSSHTTSSTHRKKKSRPPSWIVDRKWTLGNRIGKGSFGEVFECMNDKGKFFAVKRFEIAGRQSEVEALASEIELMRGLAHPNIVNYVGALVDESQGVLFIFQEWVPGGSVADLLKKYGKFSEGVVVNYTRQILLGLRYLHENGIVHRDIKGANLLVDDNGVVKLADFGASCQFDFEGTQETTTIRGTPYFMAPEVLMNCKYGRKGDIWAVGCTVVQMLTGEVPWKEFNLKTLVQLHMLLQSWNNGPPPLGSITPSPICKEFLVACFMKDPSKRPTASELLGFPFLHCEEDMEESTIRMSHMSMDSRNSSHSPKDKLGSPMRHDLGESNEGSFEESGVMSAIREQLGRVVSRTSISIDTISAKPSPNDDTIAGIEKQLEQRKQRKAQQAESEAKVSNQGDGSNPEPTQPRQSNPFVRGSNSLPKRIFSKNSNSGNNNNSSGTNEDDVCNQDSSSMHYSSSNGEPYSEIPPKTQITGMPAAPQLRSCRSSSSNPFSKAARGVSQSSARDSELTPSPRDEDPSSDTYRGYSNNNYSNINKRNNNNYYNKDKNEYENEEEEEECATTTASTTLSPTTSTRNNGYRGYRYNDQHEDHEEIIVMPSTTSSRLDRETSPNLEPKPLLLPTKTKFPDQNPEANTPKSGKFSSPTTSRNNSAKTNAKPSSGAGAGAGAGTPMDPIDIHSPAPSENNRGDMWRCQNPRCRKLVSEVEYPEFCIYCATRRGATALRGERAIIRKS